MKYQAKWTIALSSLLLAFTMEQSAATSLGGAELFNVYSLSDISYSYSDFEGTTGAAGAINLEHFSIAFKNDYSSKFTLFAGSDVNFNYGSTFHGGIEAGGHINISHIYTQGPVSSGGNVFATQGTILGSVDAFGTVSTDQTLYSAGTINHGTPFSPTIDHSAIASGLINTSLNFASRGANSSYSMQHGELILQGTSGLNVFDLTSSLLDTAWGIEFIGPSDATFILNIEGNAVNLESMGFDLAGVDLDMILYNMYEATTLNMANIGVPGTILAPYANTDFRNGVINGSLYVGNLTGNGQVNLVSFNGALPVPEPSTPLLIVLGLIVMTWARKIYCAARIES